MPESARSPRPGTATPGAVTRRSRWSGTADVDVPWRGLLSERTRAAAVLVVVMGLLGYVYSPLLASGFLGEDVRVLVALEEVADQDDRAALYRLKETGGRVLATVSLLISRSVWTIEGAWSGREALALRLEHLFLLLIAAWGLHGLLLRAIRPWLGNDPARSAAHAGAALFLLHPLVVASVGRVASRGDLLVVAGGAWAARAFLTARQERRLGGVALAGFLAVLCGATSELALFLPPLLAGMEYLSARRHRPMARRARTAFLALLAFGALVLVEWAGRVTWGPESVHALFPGERGEPTAALALEKLGVLMLPVDEAGIGDVGYLFAALAVLVALHPGLLAARAAPRLWGRILTGWVLSLAAAMAPMLGVRVASGSLGRADVLLAAAVVTGVGFGVSAVALSGWRRTVVPVVTGGLFAILGRGAALPREEAAAWVADLRGDLVEAARERDWRTTLIVLSPPRYVAGIDALHGGAGLEALLAAPFLPPPARVGGQGPRVVGVNPRTLAAWLGEEEFRGLRASGAAIVMDASALGAGADGRVTVDLAPPGEGEPRGTWRGQGRTPAGLVLDPLEARFFRVTALPEADVDRPPVIRWSSSVGLGRDVPVTGAWIPGEASPVACFDLESALPWLLGQRVRSVWFPGDLASIVSGRCAPAPEVLDPSVVPRAAGEDWSFDLSAEDPLGIPSTWRLTLLDLAGLEAVDFTAPDGGRLLFSRADAWARRALAGGGPVAWTLDRRVEGVTVARARGRVTDGQAALPERRE